MRWNFSVWETASFGRQAGAGFASRSPQDPSCTPGRPLAQPRGSTRPPLTAAGSPGRRPDAERGQSTPRPGRPSGCGVSPSCGASSCPEPPRGALRSVPATLRSRKMKWASPVCPQKRERKPADLGSRGCVVFGGITSVDRVSGSSPAFWRAGAGARTDHETDQPAASGRLRRRGGRAHAAPYDEEEQKDDGGGRAHRHQHRSREDQPEQTRQKKREKQDQGQIRSVWSGATLLRPDSAASKAPLSRSNLA